MDVQNCQKQSVFRRFLKDRDGMAATEFAMILPIMMLLFFGAVEGKTAYNVDDRVSQAAAILADVSSKEAQISYAEIDDLMIGVERIVQPLKVNRLTMNLISVVPDSSGRPTVLWSRSNKSNNLEPYAPNTRFKKLDDDEVVKDGYSVLVGEVRYNHKSGLTGQIVGENLKYRTIKVRFPRKSTVVAICDYDESTDEYSNCIDSLDDLD